MTNAYVNTLCGFVAEIRRMKGRVMKTDYLTAHDHLLDVAAVLGAHGLHDEARRIDGVMRVIEDLVGDSVALVGERVDLRGRIDVLLEANNALVEQNRALKRRLGE